MDLDMKTSNDRRPFSRIRNSLALIAQIFRLPWTYIEIGSCGNEKKSQRG